MVGSGEPPTLNAIPLVQLFVCTGTFICVVRGDGVRVSLPGQYGYKYSWPVDVSATTAAAIAAAIVGRRACRVLPFRFVSSPFLPRSLFLSFSLSPFRFLVYTVSDIRLFFFLFAFWQQLNSLDSYQAFARGRSVWLGYVFGR